MHFKLIISNYYKAIRLMKQTHQNKYLNRKGEIIMENLEKVEQLREISRIKKISN